VTFEESAIAYDHHDAEGFIKLNALRLRTLAKRQRKLQNQGIHQPGGAVIGGVVLPKTSQ
jgi:hypothetical protein